MQISSNAISGSRPAGWGWNGCAVMISTPRSLNLKNRYEFGPAAEMVLEFVRLLRPAGGRPGKRVFDQQHLDSEVRKGKRSGAFCASVTPKLTPWVHINYQGETG